VLQTTKPTPNLSGKKDGRGGDRRAMSGFVCSLFSFLVSHFFVSEKEKKGVKKEKEAAKRKRKKVGKKEKVLLCERVEAPPTRKIKVRRKTYNTYNNRPANKQAFTQIITHTRTDKLSLSLSLLQAFQMDTARCRSTCP
jgi:hypothetical protein